MSKEPDQEIIELFFRVVNKYNALEKIPVKHGSGHDLYHSERHMLDRLGDNPDLNMSELAAQAGVTKGAISQIVKKLEGKGLVQRRKSAANDKEIFVELTETGRRVHGQRKQHNAETLAPLTRELAGYDVDEIAVVQRFFRWLDRFMDDSRETMKFHSRKG